LGGLFCPYYLFHATLPPPTFDQLLLQLCLFNVPAIIASQLVAQLCVDDIEKSRQPKHEMNSNSLAKENWHLRQELFYLKNQHQNNVSKQKQKNGQPAPAKPWKKAEAIVLAIGIIIVGLLMLVSSLVQSIP
jgi:hypothetical protein